MEAVIVSTTIASVMESFGKLSAPDTYRLVVVALVVVRSVMVVFAKLAAPLT